MFLLAQWFLVVLVWYLALLSFSLLGMPLGSFLFRQFKDRGYPLYRIITLGLLSYVLFAITRFSPLRFNELSIALILGLLVFINFKLKKYTRQYFPSLRTIVLYECSFLIFLTLWSYVKGMDASLRTLEKYMDFGFIQSILNNTTLPPQDMWFASTSSSFFSINYYYFGHFVTALLTKLTAIAPHITYNLMLASIFAIGMTAGYSISYNIFSFLVGAQKRISRYAAGVAGVLGAYLMNLSGNLHILYIFTKGYPPEAPVPFWSILSGFHPEKYWYPNATRFIPLTIHEFPSYSYVVSDLHGHVLDIPFVLLTLALFIAIVINNKQKNIATLLTLTLVLGVMYMTNSTDFLVYGALAFFALVICYRYFLPVIKRYIAIIGGGLLISLPFSLSFKPFANSLGVNCAPSALVKLNRLGPFIFEADRCQTSPFWMLVILWGFLWLNALIFCITIFFAKRKLNKQQDNMRYFAFFMFIFSILLTLFAEFFYFKDIYPAHFRANTMFKLGYQAFIMMSLLSGVVIVYFFTISLYKKKLLLKLLAAALIVPLVTLVSLYPFFSVPGYFAHKPFTTLDGSDWIRTTYPELYEIITLLNKLKTQQAKPRALLEAHGDSYTDFNMVSAHTGLPTVIGWPIHEWLWRGDYNLVAKRADEVRFIYEAEKNDIKKVKKLIQKYHIDYVVVSDFERQKYPSLNLDKLYIIGKPIYQKNNTYLFSINYGN